MVNALSQLDRPQEPLGRGPGGGPLHYLGRTDLMMACYPGGGARYGPHIDNIDGDGREEHDFGRCFSLVYYLNEPDWDVDAKGGALRVHVPPSASSSWRFQLGAGSGGSPIGRPSRPPTLAGTLPS